MKTSFIGFFLLFLLFCTCNKDTDEPVPPLPKVEISVDNVSLPDTDTGSSSFTVTSDSPWKIELTDTRAVPGWFTVFPLSGEAGTTTVQVNITQENASYDDRNAYIKISSGTTLKILTVTQKKKNALILTKDKVEVGPKGGEVEIEVKANVDYEVEIPEMYRNWISKAASGGTRGLVSHQEKFSVSEGSEEGAREGLIFFKSGELRDTVHIFQAQKDVLVLTSRECNISNEATEIGVELRSNIEYDVLIPADATNWIKRLESRGSKVDRVVFSIEENEEYEGRSAKIAFKDKNSPLSDTLTIYQSQVNALILGSGQIEVGQDGGEIEIEVKANIKYEVLISDESKEWIQKIDSIHTRGLVSHKEKFSIKEGSEEKAREGLIFFKSGELRDTVHVFQARKDVLVLTSRECHVSNEACEIGIELRSNIDYDILISSDAKDWIKKIETRLSTKLDTIVFSIGENREYDYRSTEIVFIDKNSALSDTLTIYQSQVNALILGKKKIEGLSCCGDRFEITVKSNVNYTFQIPSEASDWLQIIKTRGLKENVIHFSVAVNNEYDRMVKIPCAGDGDLKDTLYVRQDGAKTILMEFYEATGGDSWINHTNWGTDKPLQEWYGIGIDNSVSRIEMFANNVTGEIPVSLGKLKELKGLFFDSNNLKGSLPDLINTLSLCKQLETIQLEHNKLSGSIPASIANFTNLFGFCIAYNYLTGTIPPQIGELKKLTVLRLSNNNLTGGIPTELGKLSQLTDFDCYNNQLTGTIPEEIGKLPKLKWISLNGNYLSAPLPLTLMRNSNWQRIVDFVIYQNGYTLYPPLEFAQFRNLVHTDIQGIQHSLYELCGQNKYTILYNYGYNCVFSLYYTPTIIDLYNKYKDKGLGVVTYHAWLTNQPTELENIKRYITESGMTPFNNLLDRGIVLSDGMSVQWEDHYFVGGRGTPEVIVVDSCGRLKYGLSEDRNQLPDFIQSLLGGPEKPYESTDFSKDGEVLTLQSASVGSGINLVFLGEGFVDKDMDRGGKYERRAREAMEHFFEKEPVKSFRDRFNVFCVKAVSLHEGIGTGKQTAFSVEYGEGTYISGNDTKCFEYALKVPAISTRENTFVITVINDSKYAGTCWMYGDNASIAYCPIVGYDADQFSQIIHHEAVGHGFAKLADEYSYTGTIPSSERETYLLQQDWGWWNNVDFTSDPATIRWHSFLQHAGYRNQVGIYEGGCTYQYGVWRSTPNSIMLDNSGEFNVPSRQAIYKWIMDLSGDTYTLEKFLEYDAVNRTAAQSAAVRRPAPSRKFVPLAPPVVILE